jgi:hypothetical protein
MVYNAAGVFLGASLANILTDINKGGKTNLLVVPAGVDQSLIQKFMPVSRFAGVLTCLAATNMFADYFTPVNNVSPCLFRIQVGLSVAGVFSVVYKIGSDTFTYTFNAGAALVASSLYIFDCLVHPNDQLNFQSSLAGIANLRIQEIALAIQ